MKKYYEQAAEQQVKIEKSALDYEIPTHFHKSVEMQLILEGVYEVYVSDEKYTIPSGSILLIPPNIEHHAPIQPDVKTYLLVVPYEYFDYFPAFLNTSDPCFILSDATFNQNYIQPLLQEFLHQRTQGVQAPQKMQSIVYIGWTNLIFGQLFSFYNLKFSTHPKKSKSELSEQILDYIDKNYADPNLSIKTIAALFNYNQTYLSRMFSQKYSIPISQYINSIRIQKFITLYYNDPHITFLQLALRCGFSSESTFYRAFFEYAKTTPSQYFYTYNHSGETPPPVLFTIQRKEEK